MKKVTVNWFLKWLVFIIIQSVTAYAQAQEPPAVSFSYSQLRIDTGEVLLKIKAAVKPGIKLYAIQKTKEDVLYSSVSFAPEYAKYLNGTVTEKGNSRQESDSSLNAFVYFFADTVVWQQKVNVQNGDSLALKGSISYMVNEAGQYKPGEEHFKFFITPQRALPAGNSGYAAGSLWWIFFSAFAGGLLALITPCVYSMIPVTVSFFTKRSKSRTEGIRNAVVYAAFIVTIFTVLGFLVTLIFGPAALNNLATNWIANLVFFALFVIFGISFLGAFDISLPSSWTNKVGSKAGGGSFMGIFFMALTLVLVSFSCTGPIIGNLLVLAARGSYIGPLIGMLGFSTALALPFALFAFFPSKLNVLGKAGGWLNGVKVTLGFLELALALKFLSNADLVRGWRLLDREVFISCWVVIFLLLGIYLLGKLKFHHDDKLPENDFGVPYLTVTRLLFAMCSLIFAVYMVPGLWGAPLKAISAFVPPMGTQDFIVAATNNDRHAGLVSTGPGRPKKYYEQMKMYEPEVVTTYGLVTYFDYDEALAAARKLNKPLMLDFTGINCVNCRKMEGEVWSDPEVMKKLKEQFVIVSLYVDVHNIDLQQNEEYYSKALQKKVATLGDKNTDFQVTKYGSNSQPYYFFVNGNEKKLIPEGYGYNPDIKKFTDLLDEVVSNYNKTGT